jgi:hypothetical protein
LINRREFLWAPVLAGAVAGKARGQNGHATAVNPQSALRTIEMCITTPPEAIFDGLDHDRMMRVARDAGFQCAMIYSMEHWGFALYDTNVGYRHPNLRYDFVQAQVDAARKYGLSPLCYYSYNFAQAVTDHHPEWRMLDERGAAPMYRGRFHYACQNSPYGQFMLDTFDELFAKYAFDGLFLDIMAARPGLFSAGHDQYPFCYCPSCRALWERENNSDFEAGMNDAAERRRRIEWERRKSGDEFTTKMLAVMQKHRPQATISGNGGCLFFWKSLIDRLSYNYGEPEFSSTGVCLGAALMRGWGQPDYQEGVWMRDQRTIADRVATSVLRAEAAAELAQGARLFAIGSLMLGNFEGGFDERTIRSVGEAFAGSTEAHRAIEGMKPVRSVAVILGESAFTQAVADLRPVPARESIFGAVHLFTSHNYPIDVVPDWQLTPHRLDGYQLVVLPETFALSGGATECVRQYVADGGTLLATGRCALLDESGRRRGDFGLADVLGLHYGGEDMTYVGNLSRPGVMYAGATLFLRPRQHALAKVLGREPVGMAGSYVRAEGDAETVFDLMLPMFKEDIPGHVFYHWFPPPAGRIAGKGVTVNRFGRGHAVYVAAEMFGQYYKTPWAWIRSWTGALLKSAAPDPPIRLIAGEPRDLAHATFWEHPEQHHATVLIANTSAKVLSGDSVPVRNLKLSGSDAFGTRSATLTYPARQVLQVQRGSSAGWTVALPDVGPLTVLELARKQRNTRTSTRAWSWLISVFRAAIFWRRLAPVPGRP